MSVESQPKESDQEYISHEELKKFFKDRIASVSSNQVPFATLAVRPGAPRLSYIYIHLENRGLTHFYYLPGERFLEEMFNELASDSKIITEVIFRGRVIPREYWVAVRPENLSELSKIKEWRLIKSLLKPPNLSPKSPNSSLGPLSPP